MQNLAAVQCEDIDVNMLPALGLIDSKPSNTSNFKLYFFLEDNNDYVILYSWFTSAY